jgi:hypothetical protein
MCGCGTMNQVSPMQGNMDFNVADSRNAPFLTNGKGKMAFLGPNDLPADTQSTNTNTQTTPNYAGVNTFVNGLNAVANFIGVVRTPRENLGTNPNMQQGFYPQQPYGVDYSNTPQPENRGNGKVWIIVGIVVVVAVVGFLAFKQG